jgi:hypothetical protein
VIGAACDRVIEGRSPREFLGCLSGRLELATPRSGGPDSSHTTRRYERPIGTQQSDRYAGGPSQLQNAKPGSTTVDVGTPVVVELVTMMGGMRTASGAGPTDTSTATWALALGARSATSGTPRRSFPGQ